MRRIGVAVVLALWLGSALAAEPAASLQSRQADAQAQQARLRDRIQELQKDINKHEASRDDAAQALKASETAISDLDRRLAELSTQKQQAEDDLKKLEGQIVDSRQELKQRQQELADQLRAQYASGLSPWAALLSGDDPQAIGRELGYLSYVSQAQAAALQAVAQALERLNTLQTRSQERKRELERVADETRQRKTELQAQKQERQRVLEKISEQLKTQRVQADKLQGDERRLGRLITGLEAAIAKQAEEARLAEARRREAARQAELRRQEEARRLEAQRAEQARQQQEEARRDQEEATRAREQVEQARERQREQEQAARSQVREAPAPAPEQPAEAAALRGLRQGLPYPVRGEVQGRFGAERPDGGVWRGIVLRAAEGTPVKAIAAGRVVYAAWLKGFGNILIVDHGAQYLSVYAYNQSLLKQVGQRVAAGDAIATVGATGGQVESGLYFEIRHQGKPVNPLLWLAR